MDDHLSLINATKDNAELGGIQDVEGDNIFFGVMQSSLPSLIMRYDFKLSKPKKSSAIIIPSFPEEFLPR